MNKLLAVTFVWFATVAMSVCTMIYGWGLEPKSWWWIIGAGIFGRFLLIILDQIRKEEDK
jgi:hypothetical protein